MRKGKSLAMRHINSMTITNAPPEKLIALREQFEERMDEIYDRVEESN
jgi:hypothetical protein